MQDGIISALISKEQIHVFYKYQVGLVIEPKLGGLGYMGDYFPVINLLKGLY